MSATGRGAERDPRDFYRTPAPVVRAILPKLPLGGRLLDAGAGDGAILRELHVRAPVDAKVGGIELDPALAASANLAISGSRVIVGNFLTHALPDLDLVVSNPPYGIAMEFVLRALALTKARNGTVAKLLRLGWLGSRERATFLEETHPDIHVLTPRPSFCVSLKCAKKCGWVKSIGPEDGAPTSCPACGAKVTKTTTDASEYAWFCWSPTCSGRWHVLPWEADT